VYPEKPRQRGPVAGYAKEVEKRLAWLEGFIVFVDQKIEQVEAIPQDQPVRLNLRHLTHAYIDYTIDRDPEDWVNIRERFQQYFGDLTHAAREGPESLKSSRGRKRSYSQLIDRPPSLQSTSDLGYNLPQVSLDTPKRHDTPLQYTTGHSGEPSYIPTNGDNTTIETGVQPPTLPRRSIDAIQNGMHTSVTDFQPQDLLALSQPYFHPSARLSSNNFAPAISSAGSTSHLNDRITSPNGFGQTLVNNSMPWANLQHSQPAHMDGLREGQASGSTGRGSEFLEQTSFNPDASTFSTSISRQAFDLDYSSNLRSVLLAYL